MSAPEDFNRQRGQGGMPSSNEKQGSIKHVSQAGDPDPPAKRRRGRPRSLVFNYFVREQEPDGGAMVNRCVFCGFRSRDKSQNPTYLARHILLACCAPDDVVQRIRHARSSPPQTDTRQAASQSFAPQSREADSSVSRALHGSRAMRQHSNAPQHVERAPGPATAALHPPPFSMPFNGSRTLPSPTMLHSEFRQRSSTLQHMGSGQVTNRTAAGPCILPPPRVSGADHALPAPQGEYAGNIREGDVAHHVPGRLPSLRILSNSDEIAQQAPISFVNVEQSRRTMHRPSYSPVATANSVTNHGGSPAYDTRMPGTVEASTQYIGPRQTPAFSNPVMVTPNSQLASAGEQYGYRPIPAFSSLDVRSQSQQWTRATQENHGYEGDQTVQAHGKSLPASGYAGSRAQVLEQCRSVVDRALGSASGSTLICLGPCQGKFPWEGVGREKSAVMKSPCAFYSLQDTNQDEGLEALETHVESMKADAYDGVCSVMVLTRESGVVYLGSEDCMLASQLASFVGSHSRHIREGSMFALLFTCSPQPSVVSELQTSFKSVFWVVDIAHSSDELCKRIVGSSASVDRCVQWTKDVSRFLAIVLPESREFEAVRNLPNAMRFSSVFVAMMQIYTHRRQIVEALKQFQRAVVQIDELRIANGISRVLKSNELAEEIYNTARLFSSLSHLVSLYDAPMSSNLDRGSTDKVSSRGIVHVRSDCENALKSMECLELPANFGYLHSSILTIVRSFLVGDDKTPDVGVGMIVGNAALLASYLDPSTPGCPQDALKVWHKQRLYRAVRVACGGLDNASVTTMWNQLSRFIFEKEAIFSEEAMSPAARRMNPSKWWSTYGHTAAPELSILALKVLEIPASVGCVMRRVAMVTAREQSLRGATLRENKDVRDHVFCAWNTALRRMRDDQLATIGSPLGLSFREMSEMLS